MSEYKQDLGKILEQIDTIALAESYGFEFKGKGNKVRAKVNLLREENTSSLDFFHDTGKFFDRATGQGGDAFDLISKMEHITITQAIIRAKELIGVDNHQYNVKKVEGKAYKKESKAVNLKKIYGQSQTDLRAVSKKAPFFLFEDDSENREEYIKINSNFERLFETTEMTKGFYKKLDYLFKNIVGWSDFWNSPTIVLKNKSGFVVDLVAYRPRDKETNEEIKGMKYHYRNFSNRGKSFLYPFQKEVEAIADREKYIIVGEGLKNALNGILHSVPFISIESTGNTLNISDELIKEIKRFLSLGYGFVPAFDGDRAGHEAYNNFLKVTGLTAENILDFNSNQDFVEYLRAN